MLKRLTAVLSFVCWAGAAFAQSAGMPYTYPVTVGTGSAQVMTVNPARKQIEFYNPSASALVAVCPSIARIGTPPTPINCAVNGPGSITLLPYQSHRLSGVGGNPQVSSAWNAVASTAGAALTIFEWE